MKSKDKNKVCFNCFYIWEMKDIFGNTSGNPRFTSSIHTRIQCSETNKWHDNDYSCKKWRLQQ